MKTRDPRIAALREEVIAKSHEAANLFPLVSDEEIIGAWWQHQGS
jgi:hypothetical protein